MNSISSKKVPSIPHLSEQSEELARIERDYEQLNDIGIALSSTRDLQALLELTEQERAEIESHVLHGVSFLNEIPWVPELREIPSIVSAHHEKMNGTGYPFGLSGEAIPLASKMMTICNIFDALSAADRPYKKAVGIQQTLEILSQAVVREELDGELVDIFVRERVFEAIYPALIR